MKKFYVAVFVVTLLFLGSGIAGAEVTAKNGMVSAAHELASKAGVEIMQKGGNAIDAAVATSLALSVVEPTFTGAGGGGFSTIRFAKTGEVVFVDYREMAPASATKDMYASEQAKKENWSTVGGKSVGVPGFIKGLFYMLEKYGTMSFAQVAEPAIRYAEEGYIVQPFQVELATRYFLVFNQFHEPDQIPFLKDGLPFPAGETFKIPELAKTYRLLAEKGPSVLYEGEIGEAMVAQVNRTGGNMTMDDLKNYEIKVRTPIEGNYRGYKIYSSPPPSSGGTHVVQILNIMENFPVDKWKVDSPERLHVLAEAVRMVFADRQKYMGDADFIKVPLKGLADKRYAKKLAEKISPTVVRDEIQPDDPWVFNESSLVLYPSAGTEGIGFNTSHFSVVDAEGNIVSTTNTHNGPADFVPVYGIVLNNEMDDFAKEPTSVNAPEPRKRPLSSMSPTVVLDANGKPFITVGSAGSWRIITAVSQIIMNIIDYNMTMDQAIQHPRIFTFATDGKAAPLLIENTMNPETVEALKKMGHNLDVRDKSDYFGTSQGILFKDGLMHGGADSRRLGVPVGY